MLLDIVTPLHKATKRDYLARMNDDKVHCMGVAKQYGEDYWDGDRRYGYGGYRYIEGKWKPVAEKLIELYRLDNNSSILDVGCGKGVLLKEIQDLLPKASVCGVDISDYALREARHLVAGDFWRGSADQFTDNDDEFDLVISINCLHNLSLLDLQSAISEIERVGKQKYICVESYRNDQELFNLQCWALTCERFHRKEEWIWLYKHFGYTGDYEFIYFE